MSNSDQYHGQASAPHYSNQQPLHAVPADQYNNQHYSNQQPIHAVPANQYNHQQPKGYQEQQQQPQYHQQQHAQQQQYGQQGHVVQQQPGVVYVNQHGPNQGHQGHPNGQQTTVITTGRKYCGPISSLACVVLLIVFFPAAFCVPCCPCDEEQDTVITRTN